MANTVMLRCIIEGEKDLSEVSVSYMSDGKPTEVDDLRKQIFEDECKHLAPNHMALAIFKVNIDPDHPEKPFHLLRFNKCDKGVEKLSPEQRVDEIWQKPPPKDQIHLFVKFTTLLPGVEGCRILSEAAQTVHDGLWGKDFNALLQDVPGYGDLQYLPAAQIESLGLRMLFCPQVLPIREEFKAIYKGLRSCGIGKDDLCRAAVVIGQPGIRKTYFLYYLLLCLLHEKQNVAFQVGDKFVLFEDSGIQLCNTSDWEGFVIPSETWALTDSWTGFTEPCPAFLIACKRRAAWIVQTTTPIEDHELWKSWRKDCYIAMLKTEEMSSYELTAFGTIRGLIPPPQNYS